jgi:RNA polymerase sigma factor (TIGR02999 family)
VSGNSAPPPLLTCGENGRFCETQVLAEQVLRRSLGVFLGDVSLPPDRTVARAILWSMPYNTHARTIFRPESLHMTDVTRILSQIESGDSSAAEKLLPLVYDELRKLAAAKMAQEKPDQTLQATALVHEAYIRLVDVDKVRHWESRGHFFAAAAEAIRRILVENARKKGRIRHGGGRDRVDLEDVASLAAEPTDGLLALDEALAKFAILEPAKAEFTKLRYFAGFSIDEAADLLGISRTTAKRYWTYARAWLLAELYDSESTGSS